MNLLHGHASFSFSELFFSFFWRDYFNVHAIWRHGHEAWTWSIGMQNEPAK
jgi:hypothetical protein